MIPDRDNFDYVGDTTFLTHANLLFLVHKIINKNNDQSNEGTVGVIPIDPQDDRIDHNLSDIIDRFTNNIDQNKISIAICRGRLQKIGELEQITGSSHWTGLHLRKIKDAHGKDSIKAYHMDSCSENVPVPVNRVLKNLGIPDAVGVKCNSQIDGHSWRISFGL